MDGGACEGFAWNGWSLGHHQKNLVTYRHSHLLLGHHQKDFATYRHPHLLLRHHQKDFDFVSYKHCPSGNMNEIICLSCRQTDVATYASLLRRCTIEKAPSQGEQVHDLIIRNGYADNLFLNNLLVQMHGKCGNLQDARAVFHNMVHRNLYSWTIMLGACSQNGHGNEALQLFGQMQTEGFEADMITSICVLDACASMANLEKGREIHGSVVGNAWELDVVEGTALVNMYGKCGSLDDARAVFQDMPCRNMVSWNAMITASTKNGHGKEAQQLYGQMKAEGFEPDKITTFCVLDACSSRAALEDGRELHANVISNGWESDIVVGNALLNMYGKCGSMDDVRAVFAEMAGRDVISWNAVIAACAQNGHGKEALQLLGQMLAEGFELNQITSICVLDACALEDGLKIHASVVDNGWESDVVMGTALINMYGRCGSLDNARAVFAEMTRQDVVSWSAMMAMCAHNGHSKEALQLFGQMQAEGFEPNKITSSCVLDACASITALEDGRQIYGSVVCHGWESDVIVATAVIKMYGKCGTLDDAKAAFAEIRERDVVSWNAMLAACAQNGHCKEALQMFGQLQAEGFTPDKITFTCVLTACSHMGLVADGMRHFTSMSADHGISPSIEHYVCVIDLLGRAGELDKAEQLINSMPFEPVGTAWLCLLSSCRIHGDVERGVRAANYAFDLCEKDASPYVMLVNILAGAGRWDDVEKVKKTMAEEGAMKLPDHNCIELQNMVHDYFVGDPAQREQVYTDLQNMSVTSTDAQQILFPHVDCHSANNFSELILGDRLPTMSQETQDGCHDKFFCAIGSEGP